MIHSLQIIFSLGLFSYIIGGGGIILLARILENSRSLLLLEKLHDLFPTLSTEMLFLVFLLLPTLVFTIFQLNALRKWAA